jgi:hypothetical protein
MAEKEIFSYNTDVLRQRAEEKAARMTVNLEAMSLEETQQMLHELHVHQIQAADIQFHSRRGSYHLLQLP